MPVRHQYGYDGAGNRVYRDNLVSAGFGEVYTYDGLNQVASFARGTLNGTKTGVSGVAARTQAWDYEGVGNWDGIDGDGVTQSRTANRQNEVTAVGGATTPGYDANGNTHRNSGCDVAVDSHFLSVSIFITDRPIHSTCPNRRRLNFVGFYGTLG